MHRREVELCLSTFGDNPAEVTPKEATMFSRVQPYAGDRILGLMETFTADARPEKVNLGVGMYCDDSGGRVPVLQSVCAAAKRIFPKKHRYFLLAY